MESFVRKLSISGRAKLKSFFRGLQSAKKYGIYGAIRVAIDLAISRMMFPGCLLIRRPFYIRIEGALNFGCGFLSGPGLVLDSIGPNSKISIGNDVKINAHVHIASCEHVSIGDRVLMASGVFISDHSHGSYSGISHTSPLVPPNDRQLFTKPVSIGCDTWIGEKVAVLPGARIGRGVVIGAGSVVTGVIPDFTVAVGAPARPIKKFDFEIERWVAV